MSKVHVGPELPVSRSGQPWDISQSRDIRNLRGPAHVNQITPSSRYATLSARLKAQMPLDSRTNCDLQTPPLSLSRNHDRPIQVSQLCRFRFHRHQRSIFHLRPRSEGQDRPAEEPQDLRRLRSRHLRCRHQHRYFPPLSKMRVCTCPKLQSV